MNLMDSWGSGIASSPFASHKVKKASRWSLAKLDPVFLESVKDAEPGTRPVPVGNKSERVWLELSVWQ